MRTWRTCALLFALLSAELACGCLDDPWDSPPPSKQPPERPIDPSELTCGTVAQCSIADSACQQALLQMTACVRGNVVPPLPPVRTLSREGLREESSVDSEPATSTAGATSAALVALHLLAPTTTVARAADEEQASSTVAFYRTDVKDLTVVSDAITSLDDGMFALSHEFSHYLQDLHGQLRPAPAQDASIDELVAASALTEGEAVVTSYRVLFESMGVPASRVQWPSLVTSLEFQVAEEVDDSASPLIAAWAKLPYALSLRHIQSVWEDGGRTQVDQLFEDAPATALDWLNLATGDVGQNAEPLDCYPPAPPEGFELVNLESLGFTGVYAMFATQHTATLLSAGNWRGDALAVYRPQDPQGSSPPVLSVWRLRFKRERDASGFVRAIAPLELMVLRFGREVSISVSSDPELAPIGPEALMDCPSEQELSSALPKPTHMNAALLHGRRTRSLRPRL